MRLNNCSLLHQIPWSAYVFNIYSFSDRKTAGYETEEYTGTTGPTYATTYTGEYVETTNAPTEQVVVVTTEAGVWQQQFTVYTFLLQLHLTTVP